MSNEDNATSNENNSQALAGFFIRHPETITFDRIQALNGSPFSDAFMQLRWYINENRDNPKAMSAGEVVAAALKVDGEKNGFAMTFAAIMAWKELQESNPALMTEVGKIEWLNKVTGFNGRNNNRTTEGQIDALASSTEIDYYRLRRSKAEELGIPVTALDKLVKTAREKDKASKLIPGLGQGPGQGSGPGSANHKLKTDTKGDNHSVVDENYESDEGDDAGVSWSQHLVMGNKGDVKDCPANLAMIFGGHPEWKGRIRKNMLTGCAEIDGETLDEGTVMDATTWCAKSLRMAVRNLSHVYSAIDHVARNNSYNPLVEYLESLPPWDGIERMATLFSDHLGSQQTPYTAFVGRMLLCSMVARAYVPGCIVRSVPILEGPENHGKSLFVHDLGGAWGKEVSTNMESTVAIAEVIRGAWVAELMEMDSLSKARASRVKAFVATRVDTYRPPYGRLSVDHKRVTVFVGTVNPNDAIAQFRAEDENTRWFPVVITEYSPDSFLPVRDQLFAEAKAFQQAGNNWWTPPDEAVQEAVKYREERTVEEPWLERINRALQDHDEITMDHVLSEVLDIPIDRQDKSCMTRVGIIMHRLGWVQHKLADGGNRVRIYRMSKHYTGKP